LNPARDDYLDRGLGETAVNASCRCVVVCGNVDHAVLIHLVGIIISLFSLFPEFNGED
jgi:hypothetical protein